MVRLKSESPEDRPVTPAEKDAGTLAERSDKAAVSVCMIVKNEAELLPRCLASVRALADEIVMVDTGSTDRSRDIAKEFDCRIFEFPWTGDFAAARNESIAHATNEWIFIIDADEELPDDAVGEIHDVISRDDADIVSLTVVNRSLDTGRVSSVLPSIRLFRRNLSLQYEGIVHNRLSIPKDARVLRTATELYHYGYDLPKDKLIEKQARSRALLQQQLHGNPDDVFANFNMAQLLLGLHGTADENTCREIVDHACRVIANYDPGQTSHAGYCLMAHYQTATALCALRRYDEAERFCRDGLQKKADYLDLMLTLANIRLARADLTGARESYERYLELADAYRPDREQYDIIMHHAHSGHIARFGLATISRLENNIDEALGHYRRVAQEYGPYLDTYYLMGILYLRRNEPGRAEEILSEEIQLHPQSAAAHIALAQALEMQGQGDRGIEVLTAAGAVIPDNIGLLFALAGMLIRMGRVQDGVGQIRAAVRAAKDDHRAYFKAAGMYFALGDFKTALDHYRDSLRLQPLWAEAYTNLGNCFFRLESYEKAAACYETALALAPEHDLTRRNLGLTYARTGRAGWALAVLREYVDRHGDDVKIGRLVGDLCFSAGDYSTAIGYYEKHLAVNPADAACLLHLADAYRNLGYYDAAEAGYRHLLKLNPGFEPARERLGETAVSGAR